MRSIGWTSSLERASWLASVGLLGFALAGCGLQEHPRPAKPHPAVEDDPPLPDGGPRALAADAGLMAGPDARASGGEVDGSPRPTDAPAPTSGVGVVIGGTMVPKE